MGVSIDLVCFAYTGISKENKKLEYDNRSLVEGYETITLYSCNITHNISKMWRESGCYNVIYSDNQIPSEEAIPVLKNALEYFNKNKKTLEKFNSPNGWGNYDNAHNFLSNLLNECIKRPKTILFIDK